MTLRLDYPPGATPLDADELACLIPRHIRTQSELNEWEQLNILQGVSWARGQRKNILDEAFIRLLHKKMFGETWSWAGDYRKSDKNFGCDWTRVAVEVHQLLGDVRAQIEYVSYSPDEIAVRFHHRLVFIHPFANGNGRHSRLMADVLVERLGQQAFTWGRKDLAAASDNRRDYIAALQSADARNYTALLAFARS
jgi:Fic-DOC domain mobile mystery protein B